MRKERLVLILGRGKLGARFGSWLVQAVARAPGSSAFGGVVLLRDGDWACRHRLLPAENYFSC